MDGAVGEGDERSGVEGEGAGVICVPSLSRRSSERWGALSGPETVTCCPLIVIALWNRSFAAGIAIKVAIFAPPPDWPKTVTLPGSPPKAAMFRRTHCSAAIRRSEEHTSELQSLMRISYAVFCLKKKTKKKNTHTH